MIQYTAAAEAAARGLAETALSEGVDGRLVGLGGVEIALKPLGRSPHNRKLLGEGVGVGFVTSNMNGSFDLHVTADGVVRHRKRDGSWVGLRGGGQRGLWCGDTVEFEGGRFEYRLPRAARA